MSEQSPPVDELMKEENVTPEVPPAEPAIEPQNVENKVEDNVNDESDSKEAAEETVEEADEAVESAEVTNNGDDGDTKEEIAGDSNETTGDDNENEAGDGNKETTDEPVEAMDVDSTDASVHANDESNVSANHQLEESQTSIADDSVMEHAPEQVDCNDMDDSFKVNKSMVEDPFDLVKSSEAPSTSAGGEGEGTSMDVSAVSADETNDDAVNADADDAANADDSTNADDTTNIDDTTNTDDTAAAEASDVHEDDTAPTNGVSEQRDEAANEGRIASWLI